MNRLALIRVLACVIVLIGSHLAFACSYFPQVQTVGTKFVVKVITTNAKPIDGVRVKMTANSPAGAVSSIVSDSRGEVQFSSISPGPYTIAALGGRLGWVYVDVKEDESDGKVVELEWPKLTHFTSTHVSGELRTGLYVHEVKNSEPLVTVSVLLLDARTAKFIKRTTTDGNGRFDLGDVPAGLYFVRIDNKGQTNSWMRENGDIFVEVVDSAPQRELGILYTHMTSCGLMVGNKREEN
jgi:hypothetical protein